MKKTIKKVIALTSVLALTASFSTVALAADDIPDNTDPNTIAAAETAGSTKVILDVTEEYPNGIYTVQIPANVKLKYDPNATETNKKWKNDPETDLVKIADGSDFIMKEDYGLSVTLDGSTIDLKSVNDDTRVVKCSCSMETFSVTPGNAFSTTSKVTFTAPNPFVAEKYVGSASFTVSSAHV